MNIFIDNRFDVYVCMGEKFEEKVCLMQMYQLYLLFHYLKCLHDLVAMQQNIILNE